MAQPVPDHWYYVKSFDFGNRTYLMDDDISTKKTWHPAKPNMQHKLLHLECTPVGTRLKFTEDGWCSYLYECVDTCKNCQLWIHTKGKQPALIFRNTSQTPTLTLSVSDFDQSSCMVEIKNMAGATLFQDWVPSNSTLVEVKRVAYESSPHLRDLMLAQEVMNARVSSTTAERIDECFPMSLVWMAQMYDKAVNKEHIFCGCLRGKQGH